MCGRSWAKSIRVTTATVQQPVLEASDASNSEMGAPGRSGAVAIVLGAVIAREARAYDLSGRSSGPEKEVTHPPLARAVIVPTPRTGTPPVPSSSWSPVAQVGRVPVLVQDAANHDAELGAYRGLGGPVDGDVLAKSLQQLVVDDGERRDPRDLRGTLVGSQGDVDSDFVVIVAPVSETPGSPNVTGPRSRFGGRDVDFFEGGALRTS